MNPTMFGENACQGFIDTLIKNFVSNENLLFGGVWSARMFFSVTYDFEIIFFIAIGWNMRTHVFSTLSSFFHEYTS